TNPTTEATTPCLIESAPKEGPTVRSSKKTILAGRAPERSIKARSSPVSLVKSPVICPLSLIRSFILGKVLT
ncbi:MAG: hypothetical protein FD167_4379, partial [bacterium]